jgi:FkbH-like protein
LRQVARELNVGLDSIVLLDDDPAVRLEVAARVPEVHVVPLPAEPERYVATLDRLWLFDRQSATEEDRSRTRMIAAERQRRKATRSAVGLEDYLNRLELHVDFRPAGSRDLPRVAQLTQKTNQFNLSLRRRSLEQVKTLGPETDTYVVSARDRFGEYGTVGVGILGPARGRAGDVELETFLLSCRALGRGIEQAFLARLCDAASARGARSLHAPFVEGPRNKPVRHFLEQSGFVVGADDTLERQLDDTPPMPSHITWEPAVDGR